MTLTLITLFVLGLVVGSFLNVCIYRVPRHESVAWPGSRCTSCGRALSWFENVPVMSWLLLRGRCRTCGTSISIVYPLVEVATALLFVGVYLAYGWTPLLAIRLAFGCALIVLFVVDWQHQILPNPITLPGIAIGVLCSLAAPPGVTSSLVGAAAGGGFPFLIAEIYFRVRGREGMGMGDFKMLAMVGAFLGWPLIWVALLLACFLGVLIGGGALLVARRDMATRIPFGTFIAAAALICTLWEPGVLALWERTMTGYLAWSVGSA
jgi:leader peptidase (prepilin peptidase)/N-methyltransferase